MNYSFRKKNKTVKYVVIHYTGMKSLNLAYKKLSDKKSNVSAHYIISTEGKIYNLLCLKFKAWHAGKSRWRNNININDYSLGIELENKGHNHGYQDFTKKQYLALKKLVNFLKKSFNISDKNIIYHSDISPNRKKDPGEKFILKNIGVKRFKNPKHTNMNLSLNNMLNLYGFHKYYINNHKKYCIMAVKRTLNYKKISSKISKNFLKNFYNLLFS